MRGGGRGEAGLSLWVRAEEGVAGVKPPELDTEGGGGGERGNGVDFWCCFGVCVWEREKSKIKIKMKKNAYLEHFSGH